MKCLYLQCHKRLNNPPPPTHVNLCGCCQSVRAVLSWEISILCEARNQFKSEFVTGNRKGEKEVLHKAPRCTIEDRNSDIPFTYLNVIVFSLTLLKANYISTNIQFYKQMKEADCTTRNVYTVTLQYESNSPSILVLSPWSKFDFGRRSKCRGGVDSLSTILGLSIVLRNFANCSGNRFRSLSAHHCNCQEPITCFKSTAINPKRNLVFSSSNSVHAVRR